MGFSTRVSGDFVPARPSGRASLQEPWGLPSDKVTMVVSRVSERTIGNGSTSETPRRGIREDPGREQLCS